MRKRWIESRVRAAIAEGASQLVVLGAGLDTLGVRLAMEFPEIRVIEIDHPATMSVKRSVVEMRLGRDGPVMVERDFVRDDWNQFVLSTGAIDHKRRTIFLAEGLLMYLPEARVRLLLGAVANLTERASRLLFSFMVQREGAEIGFEPRSAMVSCWLAMKGEPFLWSLDPARAVAFARELGWAVTEHADSVVLGGLATSAGGNHVIARGEEVIEAVAIDSRGISVESGDVRSKLPGSLDDFRADSGTIHVVCGYHDDLSKAFSISSRDIICLRDDLSCGPLGSLNDLDGWIAMRRSYWDHAAGYRSANRKRRRRSKSVTEEYVFGSLDRLADANEVAIWIGTGLAEQLALAWMPQFLRAIGRLPESLKVVQFERSLSGAAVPTFGILSRDDLRSCPIARSIDRAGLAYLDKAWRAVTASNPAALMEFIDQAPGAFPLLRTAFERVLWRYPDIRSGLNRYEARLLSSTRDEGPTAAKIIASTMFAFLEEENERVGDNWLLGRLRDLGEPTRPHPAVALTGEPTTTWGTEVQLTPEGKQFLRGELNFVELNGIDDWVGGVHLDSRAGDVWFNQDRKIVRR
jgi:methyltransferase (TIGR00027 family)